MYFTKLIWADLYLKSLWFWILVNLLQMWDFYIQVKLAGHYVHPYADVLEKHPTHVLKLLKES